MTEKQYDYERMLDEMEMERMAEKREDYKIEFIPDTDTQLLVRDLDKLKIKFWKDCDREMYDENEDICRDFTEEEKNFWVAVLDIIGQKEMGNSEEIIKNTLEFDFALSESEQEKALAYIR